MNVLQLYYKLPFPPNDGGSVSIYKMSKMILNAGCNLDILALNQKKNPGHLNRIPATFRKQVFIESFKLENRLFPHHFLLSAISNYSIFVHRFYDDGFNQALINRLKNNKYDIIQLEHLYLGLYIPTIKKFSNAKIIYRAQNVEHQLWESILQKHNGIVKWSLKIEVQKLKNFENKIIEEVDGVLAISPQDQKELSKSKTPIRSIAMPFERKQDPKVKEVNQFYTLGSMDWQPNRQGVEWLLAGLYDKKLNQKIEVAGRNMPSYFKKKYKNKNIEIVGEVEEVTSFLKKQQVLLAPLKSGGGIKVKILEAFAHNKAVIATHQAVKGLDLNKGEHYLEANTIEEFFDAMNQLSHNPNLVNVLNENTGHLLNTIYSIENLSKQLTEAYSEIVT